MKLPTNLSKTLLSCIFTIIVFAATAQTNVSNVNQVKSSRYLDTKLPVEERVKDLLSQLTLEEKATLLNHRGPLVSRFNIRSDGWNQCLHGVWWNRPTTMFPVSIAMAATWDTQLIYEVATA